MSDQLPQLFNSKPFSVPPDDDLVFFSELKQALLKERHEARKQSVYQRTQQMYRTGAIRRINEIADDNNNMVPSNPLSRVPLKLKAKESLPRTLAKKREMLLLQMKIDLKKEEIQKVEQYAYLREQGLKCSEDMLIEDMNKFNQFWDECKRHSHNAIKEVKHLYKQKLEVTQEVNTLHELIHTHSNLEQKQQETLAEYETYKVFLDTVLGLPIEVLQGKPQVLTERFDKFIENNLVLIENIQDIEQELEQTRQELQRQNTHFDQEIKALQARKAELLKSLAEKTKGCTSLETKLGRVTQMQESSSSTQKLRESVLAFRTLVPVESYAPILEVLEKVEGSLDTLLKIFYELEHMKLLRPAESKLLANLISERHNARQEKARHEAIESLRLLNEEKSRRYQEREMHSVQKRVGRVAMPKFMVPEQRKPPVKPQVSQEDLDWQEFFS